jgi:hypothetical protein
MATLRKAREKAAGARQETRDDALRLLKRAPGDQAGDQESGDTGAALAIQRAVYDAIDRYGCVVEVVPERSLRAIMRRAFRVERAHDPAYAGLDEIPQRIPISALFALPSAAPLLYLSRDVLAAAQERLPRLCAAVEALPGLLCNSITLAGLASQDSSPLSASASPAAACCVAAALMAGELAIRMTRNVSAFPRLARSSVSSAS